MMPGINISLERITEEDHPSISNLFIRVDNREIAFFLNPRQTDNRNLEMNIKSKYRFPHKISNLSNNLTAIDDFLKKTNQSISGFKIIGQYDFAGELESKNNSVLNTLHDPNKEYLLFVQHKSFTNELITSVISYEYKPKLQKEIYEKLKFSRLSQDHLLVDQINFDSNYIYNPREIYDYNFKKYIKEREFEIKEENFRELRDDTYPHVVGIYTIKFSKTEKQNN
jgi:hypothetical protein